MLILRKFARDLPAVAGLLIVLAVVAVALLGPWLAPHPGDAAASHLLKSNGLFASHTQWR